MAFKALLGRTLSKYSATINIVLATLGLLYLAIYAFEVVFHDQSQVLAPLEVASSAIWTVFALDVLSRLITSANIGTFLKNSWLEVLALLIPFVRVLRVFRVAVAIRGLRPFLKSRIATTGTYIFVLLPLTWFAGAVAVLDAENKDVDSSISNLPDALWWSLATITTVGYGEYYPKTFEGKFVAGILMIMGIALFSAGAGMFASWIMGEKKSTE